jgi:hypothetical protein
LSSREEQRCRPKSKQVVGTAKRPNKSEEAEQKSGLAGHYREIGIKSVAAATRKESTASPRARDPVAINRKRKTEGGQNE